MIDPITHLKNLNVYNIILYLFCFLIIFYINYFMLIELINSTAEAFPKTTFLKIIFTELIFISFLSMATNIMSILDFSKKTNNKLSYFNIYRNRT